MAKTHRATLMLLHVLTPIEPVVPEQYIDSATWVQIRAETRRRAQKQLTRFAETARTKGVRATTLLLEGDPTEQILRAVRSRRVDLLVVGSHGRTGFSKFLLGSVAGRLVAMAPCPVVTVRRK